MKPALQHELNDAFASVLDDMQQAASRLLTALESERIALNNANPTSLDEAGSTKQAIMHQLEQLDAERVQLCREHPARLGAREPQWAHIVESLGRCHVLNQRNGSAVNQRLTQVRQALAVLTGHAGESTLYGRSGALHTSLRSQVLAAA